MTKQELLMGCSQADLQWALDHREVPAAPYGCLGKAAMDEPLFVLKSTDRTTPKTVRQWSENVRGMGGSALKVAGGMDAALEIEAWQREHPDLVKVPD